MGEAGKTQEISEANNSDLQDQTSSIITNQSSGSSSSSSKSDTEVVEKRKGKKKSKKKNKKKKHQKNKKEDNALKKALKQEETNQKIAERLLVMDERKRPYNSMYEAKAPTEEEMEAYYLKRKREEDPMSDFVK